MVSVGVFFELTEQSEIKIEEEEEKSSLKTETESVHDSEKNDKLILAAELEDLTKGMSGFVLSKEEKKKSLAEM